MIYKILFSLMIILLASCNSSPANSLLSVDLISMGDRDKITVNIETVRISKRKIKKDRFNPS